MTSSVLTLRHYDVISHVAFEERDYGFCSGWKFGEKSSRFIESEKIFEIFLNFHFLSTIYKSTAFNSSTKVTFGH